MEEVSCEKNTKEISIRKEIPNGKHKKSQWNKMEQNGTSWNKMELKIIYLLTKIYIHLTMVRVSE
jgi:hypothetical protein